MENDNNKLINLVKQCSLFSYFSDEIILNLIQKFKKIELKSQNILFMQGDISDNLYILIQGRLKTFATNYLGEKNVIGEISPIETVGELGVITGELRTLTVVADLDSVLLMMPGKVFTDLYHENALLASEILKIISKRAVTTIELISKKDIFKMIVIFSANKSIPLRCFEEQLKMNMGSTNFDLLSSETKASNKLISTLIELKNRNKPVIFFVDAYNKELFDLIFQSKSIFFLLGKGETDYVELEKYSEEILQAINQSSDINLQLILLHDNDVRFPINTERWLNISNFKMHHQVRLNFNNDYQRLLRFMNGKAYGLVLGGGGHRKFFHYGVIKYLNENHIPIDIIGGSSAGAVVGSSYAYYQDYSISLKNDIEFTQLISKNAGEKFPTFPLVSLYSGKVYTDMLKEATDNILLENLWLPFFCISSNLSKNKQEIHSRGLAWEVLRACTSYPLILPPMVMNGEIHCDGGILNNLPTDVMRNLIGKGGTIIASQLTHFVPDNKHYNFPPSIGFLDSILYKMKLTHQDYIIPSFQDLIYRVMTLGGYYKEEINTLEADVLIQGDLSNFMNFSITNDQIPQLIDLGYDVAQKAFDKKSNLKDCL